MKTEESGGRGGEMRDRGVETRERENGKGREEKEALPWQGSEEKGEKKGGKSGALLQPFPLPAPELNFPSPGTVPPTMHTVD